uniref:Wsv267-like protein n=1 Tax=Melicertus latisulcatus majanivirus TaxID=2984277 RepID=A0A9C7CDB9_9VIRU|nr:MAG: wsv267-like protein [Melicertus latisulcatus majanivirus]
MDYCNELINSIKKLNILILQAHCIQGSTDLIKMASLYLYRDVLNAIQTTPILLSEMPYSMIIVIKVSNIDIKQFFEIYLPKIFFIKHLKSGKVNYPGIHYDKPFIQVMRHLELWFDKRLRDNCPNCSMGIREKLCGYSNNLDMGFSLSFPVMVDVSGSPSENSRVVDFRMVYIAGYVNSKEKENTHGVFSFPIISGTLLKWSTHDDDVNNDNGDGSSNNNNDNNNDNIIKEDKDDELESNIDPVSKMCCLLHYLWTRELTKEMLESNTCLVRALSINPTKISISNIHNKQYFTIKKLYETIGCNPIESVYVQEFLDNVKVILLL